MQNDFCSRGRWLDHKGVDITAARKPITPLRALCPSVLHVYNPDGRSIGLGDPLPAPASGAKVLERDSWAAAVWSTSWRLRRGTYASTSSA